MEQLGPAPDVIMFEPDLQKKLDKINKLGWIKMRWADGFSLLHWACKKNRFDLVRYLLEKAPFKDEIDIQMTDGKGSVPVEYTKSDAIKEYLVWRKSLTAARGGATPGVGVAKAGGQTMAGKQEQIAQSVDLDVHKDINVLLLPFVEAVAQTDESVPHAIETLMDKWTALSQQKNHEKTVAVVREATKDEAPVVKNSIQYTDKNEHVLVAEHGAFVEEVHGDGEGSRFHLSDYGHKRVSTSTEAFRARSAIIERIIQVNRADKDLGLIMGLSGLHVIGFANERLIHDFELGDQIVAINNEPVGVCMDMCRAVRLAVGDGQKIVTIKFSIKRGTDEAMRKMMDDGYFVWDVRNYFQQRKDMLVLAGAALKCGLVNLPGGEDNSFVLGHCCGNDQEARNILNGVFGHVRECKIEIEFLPGRPKSLGLELALGSTKIRRFALNAANCRYVGKNYFVANDIVVSVGNIRVCTEVELKEAYAQARDNHDSITFIVKREVGNVQPEFDFSPSRIQPVEERKAEGVPAAVGGGPYDIQTTLNMDQVLRMIPPEYKKALEKVRNRGWDNTKWDRGYTLLHWSARKGDLELCKFFIAAVQARPNCKDDRGLTPKDHASKKGHAEIVHFFETVCHV